MANPLFYIFGLFIAFLYPVGIEPLWFVSRRTVGDWIPLPSPVAGVLGCTLLYGAAMTLLWWRVIFRRTGPDPEEVQHQRQRAARLRLWLRLLQMSLYAVEVFLFHIPSYAREVTSHTPWPSFFSGVSMYLPFLALAGLHGLFSLALERKLLPERSTVGRALMFHGRGFMAFVLIPILVILALNALMTDDSRLSYWVTVYPFLSWMISIVLVILLITLAPLMLRFFLGAVPLPAGPLRIRLEAAAARADLTYSNLLLWKTHGVRVGNAFITGLFGRCRYIFFTDYLTEQLSPEDVEAVISHEIGHVRGKHILLTLMFSISFILLVTLLFEVVLNTLQVHVLIAIQFLLFAFLFWAVLFGYISRRFETQADFFGMHLCGSPTQFIHALARVADINILPKDAPSHRHFSIARRIQILQHSLIDPGIPMRIHRNVTRVMIGLTGVLVLGGLTCLWSVTEQLRTAPERQELLDRALHAMELEKNDRWDEAEKAFSRLIGGGLNDAELYLQIGELQQKLNRPEKARQSFLQAFRLGLRDPQHRLFVQNYLLEEKP